MNMGSLMNIEPMEEEIQEVFKVPYNVILT